MQEKRILLPFTGGVDSKALHSVLRFVSASDATLVALILIPLSIHQQPDEVRLECLQQATDLLELLKTYATLHNISLEFHKIFTYNVNESVTEALQQYQCEKALLFYEEEKLHFLHATEAKQLRISLQPAQIVLVQALTQKKAAQNIFRQIKATVVGL